MKRRQCVAAFIIRSSTTGSNSSTSSPVQPVAKTSFFSRTPAALSPVKSPSAGGIGSLYVAPIIRTAERNRKTGDVYFIIDEETALIASPDKSKLDEGNIIVIEVIEVMTIYCVVQNILYYFY